MRLSKGHINMLEHIEEDTTLRRFIVDDISWGNSLRRFIRTILSSDCYDVNEQIYLNEIRESYLYYRD